VDLKKHALDKIKLIEVLVSTEENVGEGIYPTIIIHHMQLYK
jgi:hypothetical protein